VRGARSRRHSGERCRRGTDQRCQASTVHTDALD
jgi:hypothetical protein